MHILTASLLLPAVVAGTDPDGLWVEDGLEAIHEIRAEAAGDQFGWIARNLGDVDGDGACDFAVSAPFKTISGAERSGKAYVYSGRTGGLLWSRDGGAGELLGIGIGEAGDTNGDGVPDVVIGAPGSRSAYICSGDDGRVLQRIGSPVEGVAFARKAMGIGDADGDGCADVLLGSPGFAPPNSGETPGPGFAFLYSGKTGELLATLEGEEPGDAFGNSVGGGVIDGVCNLVVGARNAGEGDTGVVYVYTFEDGEATQRFRWTAGEGGTNYGYMFVSLVGDVDADGAPDIYTTDWTSNHAAEGAGRIVIRSGRTGEILHDIDGATAGENFGIGTCEAGDLDGDGHDDFAVGSWRESTGAPSAGKVTAFSGRTGEVLATWTSTFENETFGFDVTDLGDVNGDGVIDLLLTSAWSLVEGEQSGRVGVISSGVEPKD
jgi:hypothetical protein